jgi:predicted ATPase
LIFIVDDLQWADVASLELLKRLVMNSLIWRW